MSRLALLVPLFAMVLVPPLFHSLQRPDSDIYHDPGFYTLYTTHLLGILGGVPVVVLTFAFLNTGFVFARGFVELPTPYPILECHATSLLSLILQPGLRSFAVTEPSSDVALMMPQTMHCATHLTMSCLLRRLYF